MKSVFKIILALFLVSLCFSMSPPAWQEFSQTIKKEFEISPDGTTSISNKYGKVDVKTWNNNRVRIEVKIVVNTTSEDLAHSVFQRIGVDFKNAPSRVEASTNIEPEKKSWWGWNSGKADYSINYQVYMPPSNRLEVDAKYCDVSVGELNNGASVNVKYGSFEMDGLKGDALIELAYGKGKLAKAGDVSATVSNGTLSIGQCRDIALNSKYSVVNLENTGEIRCETRFDTYKVGQAKVIRNLGKYDNLSIKSASEIYVNSKNTECRFDKIAGVLDANISYGNIYVGEMSKSFSSVDLLGDYTDISIGLPKGTPYVLDASANYAGIGYPKMMTVTYEKEQMTSHEVKGYAGSNNGSLIKARLRYGALKIREE